MVANPSLILAPTIFKTGTFRTQPISLSWLCRHPGAKSLNLDVWSKGRRIPPSLPWMQAAFILRRVINARMCLSHPHHPPRPPLKFFQTSSVATDFPQPAWASYHEMLLLPCALPWPLPALPGQTTCSECWMPENIYIYIFKVFSFEICQLQNGKHHLSQCLPEASEQGSRSRLFTDTQFWSTLLTTSATFIDSFLAEV